MKLLLPVAEPPLYASYFEQIRNSKKAGADKQQLTDHAEEILARYEAFSHAWVEGRLHELAPMRAPADLATALRSCYGRNKGASAIKAAIKGAQPVRRLKYCPMCGTTLPSTHDHYLPGVRFPEFSVHPLNLVPCCAKCNSTKDDDWLDANGRRQYLHFYSDDLPDEPFLQVELHQHAVMAGVGATFSLAKPATMTDEQWHLVLTHFTRLGLLEFYIERANDEIAQLLVDCAIHLRQGGGNARMFLSDHAADEASVWGINHWRVVLMTALSGADDLYEWIEAVPPL